MRYRTRLAIAGAMPCAFMPMSAHASGLDIIRQNYSVLFEQGTVIETNTAFIAPKVEGTISAPGFGATGDVLPNFWVGSLGLKTDLSDSFSLAVIGDRPYYADMQFNQFAIGPVTTTYETLEFTALLRYKFDNRWSVFGGPRLSTFEAKVDTFGLKYDLDTSTAFGYTAGLAYEDADTGLLARLAYKSPMYHHPNGNGMTVTTSGIYPVTGEFDVELPQSVMLDVRAPILPTTFLLGSITWNEWSALKIRPGQNTGDKLFSATNYDDNWVFEAGLAQFLTEHWIVSGSVTYDTGTRQPAGLDTIYSHQTTYAAGLTYLNDKVQITGTVGYTALGDSRGDSASASFAPARYADNDVWSSRLNMIFKF